jgi:hypothetical protein
LRATFGYRKAEFFYTAHFSLNGGNWKEECEALFFHGRKKSQRLEQPEKSSDCINVRIYTKVAKELRFRSN